MLLIGALLALFALWVMVVVKQVIKRRRFESYFPEHGQQVTMNAGYAYWIKDGKGFFRAPYSDEEIMTDLLEKIDPMEVPADQLDYLMEVMSHLTK